jgi:IclR family acetate operon transcriptional repressor
MRVVVRSLSVLTVLSDYLDGLSQQELCDRLAIPLASMHRILKTLADENFVTRSPVNKKYFLGVGAKNLGKTNDFGSLLVSPPLQLLDAARTSGETTFLTQLVGKRIVCVSMVESHHSLRLFVRIGQEMPIYPAASARSILAFVDDQLLGSILIEQDGITATGDGPRNNLHFLAHLEHIREQGFDVCDNELDDDVWAVSAPIYNIDGKVTMAVTLAGASARMNSVERRVNAASTILKTAKALSELRGFRIPNRDTTTLKGLRLHFGELEPPPSKREEHYSD